MSRASAYSRSASPAIRGYAYQFNLTIVKILQATPAEVITVEGCEDIDIFASASAVSVQCKYLTAARYTLAGIRDAVLAMLESYADGRKWDYCLYVHFGDRSEKPPSRLTVDDLKLCLTERKRKLAETVFHYERFEDSALQGFTERFTIVEGPSYEEQVSRVLTALREVFGGSEADATELHYGNALAYVVELATNSEIEERKVTRKSFIDAINKRPVLLNRWTRELLGEERFLRDRSRRLRQAGAFSSTLRRGMVVNASSFAEDTAGLYHVVRSLALDGFGPGKLKSAIPWTVLIEDFEGRLVRLKTELAAEGIHFHDGYEDYSFNPRVFDRAPLLNTKGASAVIADAAYSIRIISAETYAKHFQSLEPITFLAAFGELSPSHYVPRGLVHSIYAPFISADQIMSFVKEAVKS